ncbi:MAG: hypothetical protein JXB10_00850 [Pirellulales bacterium]|nr:hypothetical protein [Pirellulales bacterium]
MQLPKYSLGVGDRFAHEGPAQLDALILARQRGVAIAPVWNKSHREHTIVGSRPADARAEADHAVRLRGWSEPYFVDADHVGLKTVDAFLDCCDFFTLDVADWIGRPTDPEALSRFAARCGKLVGRLTIPGIDEPVEITEALVAAAGKKFLAAVQEAGRIYRHVAEAKQDSPPVIELSMDETDQPQTPVEMLLILAAAADEAIPVQTVAPRFSGRFNKGVDYVGDVAQFRREFEEDLAVIAWSVREFGLPENLKLSVHSGSDKFSIYGPIRKALKQFDTGIHLKTAGTTWLEELIGLAAAGGDGLEIAKEIYAAALARCDELCGPYASVVDIDRARLPSADVVRAWDGESFAQALRHEPACPQYNPHLRQLLHVGYKLAAEMGGRFTAALEKHAPVIAAGVTENLYQRHICPLFLDE